MMQQEWLPDEKKSMGNYSGGATNVASHGGRHTCIQPDSALPLSYSLQFSTDLVARWAAMDIEEDEALKTL